MGRSWKEKHNDEKVTGRIDVSNHGVAVPNRTVVH